MTDPSAPVLVAYDGSDGARSAIERAAPLLRPGPAQVVCVWTSIADAVPAAALGAPTGMALEGGQALDDDARGRAERLAAEGAELAREHGLEAEGIALEGRANVWQTLAQHAEAIDAGAILAGTRGRSTVASALLGSTVQGLLHHGGRPLVIVPPAR